MSNLMPNDIITEVDDVLRGVQEMTNNRGRAFLTAYQILGNDNGTGLSC